MEVLRNAQPEPSQGPWRQASEVCLLKTARGTSREEVDHTRCDNVPVLPLYYHLLASLFERS